MSSLKWKTLSSRRVYATPIFDLLCHRRQHRTRGPHDFYVLSAPDWINIIPLTPEGDVVMVRQYRHGIEDLTLEVPGGMVDPDDAHPMAAARREMVEESGYDSDQIVELGKVHPNPAILGNYCHSFLARDVRQVGEPVQHGSEETEVVRIPLARIREMIAGGEIMHALTITAFSFFQFYNSARR